MTEIGGVHPVIAAIMFAFFVAACVFGPGGD